MGVVVGVLSSSGVVVAKKWPVLPESRIVVMEFEVEGPSAAVEICWFLFVTGIDKCVDATGLSVLGSPRLHS